MGVGAFVSGAGAQGGLARGHVCGQRLSHWRMWWRDSEKDPAAAQMEWYEWFEKRVVDLSRLARALSLLTVDLPETALDPMAVLPVHPQGE